MKRQLNAMRKSSLLLSFYALIGVLFVVTANLITRDQIAENQRVALQQKWNEVLDASRYTNDLNEANKTISAEEIGLPYDAIVYLARSKEGQPVAAIFRVTTLQGYSGAITLLVAVNYADQHLTGVRVVKHQETPGLGDKIEVAKGDWILGFKGKFLTNPSTKSWAVKRDGGEFDQFTGATITPRAIVSLVEDVLIYAHQNMQRLFKEPITPNTGDTK
ncbi:MAG: electron transport complex subunit RsxG [Cocleimonas sp.]|nr:electron transport complex subunit RsxG [Cocleimonas sp.]